MSYPSSDYLRYQSTLMIIGDWLILKLWTTTYNLWYGDSDPIKPAAEMVYPMKTFNYSNSLTQANISTGLSLITRPFTVLGTSSDVTCSCPYLLGVLTRFICNTYAPLWPRTPFSSNWNVKSQRKLDFELLIVLSAIELMIKLLVSWLVLAFFRNQLSQFF